MAQVSRYDAVLAVVIRHATLPKGQVFRAAGPSVGGWAIVAVHESKQSWELFRDGTLRPAFDTGIKGSLASLPQESEFEVDNLQK